MSVLAFAVGGPAITDQALSTADWTQLHTWAALLLKISASGPSFLALGRGRVHRSWCGRPAGGDSRSAGRHGRLVSRADFSSTSWPVRWPARPPWSSNGSPVSAQLWRVTEAQWSYSKAAWLFGAAFITAGEVPFALTDPLQVIPAGMTGGAVSGALVVAFATTITVPPGQRPRRRRPGRQAPAPHRTQRALTRLAPHGRPLRPPDRVFVSGGCPAPLRVPVGSVWLRG